MNLTALTRCSQPRFGELTILQREEHGKTFYIFDVSAKPDAPIAQHGDVFVQRHLTESEKKATQPASPLVTRKLGFSQRIADLTAQLDPEKPETQLPDKAAFKKLLLDVIQEDLDPRSAETTLFAENQTAQAFFETNKAAMLQAIETNNAFHQYRIARVSRVDALALMPAELMPATPY